MTVSTEVGEKDKLNPVLDENAQRADEGDAGWERREGADEEPTPHVAGKASDSPGERDRDVLTLSSTVRKPSPVQSGRETNKTTWTGRKEKAISIRGQCAHFCKKIWSLQKSCYIDGRVRQGHRLIHKARCAFIHWRRSEIEMRDEAIYRSVKITQYLEENRTEAVTDGAPRPPNIAEGNRRPSWVEAEALLVGRRLRLARIRIFPNGPAASAGQTHPSGRFVDTDKLSVKVGRRCGGQRMGTRPRKGAEVGRTSAGPGIHYKAQ